MSPHRCKRCVRSIHSQREREEDSKGSGCRRLRAPHRRTSASIGGRTCSSLLKSKIGNLKSKILQCLGGVFHPAGDRGAWLTHTPKREAAWGCHNTVRLGVAQVRRASVNVRVDWRCACLGNPTALPRRSHSPTRPWQFWAREKLLQKKEEIVATFLYTGGGWAGP
jgi:hypothetical protein